MPAPPEIRMILERLRLSLWRPDAKMSEPETLDALKELGKSGKPEGALVAFQFLFRGGVIAACAAGTIEQIIKACTSLELAQIDSSIRAMGEWQFKILPNEINRLSHGLSGTLGVISCHRSGFIREPAVRALSQVRDGSELPFLLIRLNDWVGEVGRAAKQGIVERIRPEYAEHFVRHLPLVFRLSSLNRGDQSEVIEPLHRMLRSPECRPAVLRGMSSSDRHASRAAFHFLLSFDKGETEAIARGLRSEDTVIRLTAAREARVRLHGQLLVQTLTEMTRDRFMPVRREALYGYVERLPDLAAVELRASLWDPHPSMRETARSYLRKSGESEFAGLYRNKVEAGDDNVLAVAVAGLGETGSAADAVSLEGFMGHPSARVRKAAVRAVGRLDPERFVEQLLARVDDVAGVANAAGEVLRQHFYLLQPSRLWEHFNELKSRHGRLLVLELISRVSWWDSAPLLIAAISSNEVEVSQRAQKYLEQWRHNTQRLTTRPAGAQLALLEEMRHHYGAHLDRAAREDVDAHISYVKRDA